MQRKLCAIVVMSVWVVVIGMYAPAVTANTDIPRMTVENLKKLLDDPKSDVIILDVRIGSSWTKSEVMIKSAIREDPDDFAAWAKKHPKKPSIVLYCT
jgi:rhodanese-related sulfurtransferase